MRPSHQFIPIPLLLCDVQFNDFIFKENLQAFLNFPWSVGGDKIWWRLWRSEWQPLSVQLVTWLPLPPQATRAPISQYPNLEPQIATLCAKSATTTVSPSPQGTFDRAVPLSSPFHSFPINPRLPQETTRDLGLRRNNGSNMWRGRQRGAGTLLTGVAADTRWCKVGARSSVVL